MKALTYHGPADVRVETKPDPRIEHPRDAIVRVTRTAICGSDLHLYRGLVPDTRVGHTFGHEFTGVVEETGPALDEVRVGDRVVVPFNISCGDCFYCRRELYGMCENSNPNSEMASGVFGYSHTTGGYDGGQAELVRVPFADVGPMEIPDDMDDEEVLLLSDVFPTGYQAAEMGGVTPGDTVVVFGCGPVGHFAQISAWLMGADRVIAVDRVEDRLDFCRRANAVETVDFGRVDDVVPHLKEMTDGRGADVCIDAVGMEADGSRTHEVLGRYLRLQAGSAVAVEWCVQAARKGGTVVVVGVYGPPWNLVPIGTAMNKGLTFRMAQTNTRRYMPHLLDHVRKGRVQPDRLVSHRMPLERAPEAYEMFARKEDGCRKVVLAPS